MRFFVIDPGYSFLKYAVVEGGKIKELKREPTIIAEIPSWAVDFSTLLDNEKTSCVEWNGRKFLVGPPACGGLRIPISRENLFDLVFPLQLLKLGLRQGDSAIVLISLSDWDRALFVKDLLESLFVEGKVLPQGYGVWLEAGAPSSAVVIDIGFDTVDVIPFRNKSPEKHLAFSMHGTGLVSFLLQLHKDDPHELAARLEQGDERLKEVLKSHYWPWLSTRLQARPEWKVIKEEKKIFGGGGAHFLPEGIGTVVKNPELANVSGVAKALLKKIKKGERS